MLFGTVGGLVITPFLFYAVQSLAGRRRRSEPAAGPPPPAGGEAVTS
jgi:hypothetical protein